MEEEEDEVGSGKRAEAGGFGSAWLQRCLAEAMLVRGVRSVASCGASLTFAASWRRQMPPVCCVGDGEGLAFGVWPRQARQEGWLCEAALWMRLCPWASPAQKHNAAIMCSSTTTLAVWLACERPLL